MGGQRLGSLLLLLHCLPPDFLTLTAQATTRFPIICSQTQSDHLAYISRYLCNPLQGLSPASVSLTERAQQNGTGQVERESEKTITVVDCKSGQKLFSLVPYSLQLLPRDGVCHPTPRPWAALLTHFGQQNVADGVSV